MEWWNNLVNWVTSEPGSTIMTSAVLPFVAIVLAGVIAALIARGAIKRLLARQDRELKAAAIGTLVGAARQAAVWHSLSPQEQLLADRAAGDADIQVRMLPIRGADVAADWAEHEIAEFKRGSATFAYQFDTLLTEFRNRLVEWQHRPGRARKIFQSDIARWSIEVSDTERELQSRQDAWVAQQQAERYESQHRGGRTASPVVSADSRPAAQPAAQQQNETETMTLPVSPIPRSQSGSREVEAPVADYDLQPVPASSPDSSSRDADGSHS
ncbi:hypothetical protein [Planctomonas deserti]|uniref:hypothetical protein n=1 Tax=Planctomonas deserti TaxID=2144185 RepID=UPI000D3D1F73|nr:hypothetical protein [Planctomonas deserti]